MPYNDTTVKNGLIQYCEFYCNLGDGGISGDSTLLKIFTARINDAFDRLLPLLLSYSDYLRFDDTNQTDLPVGTFNLVSGQADYQIAQDDNSLDILNLTNVRILPSSSSTVYQTLQKLTIDDDRAVTAMSPNSTDTGIPTHYLERGNTIFFYPKPNYSSTNGGKIFFERSPSYFVSSDTTKNAGIPRPFQGLLPLYASYDWILVNKPTNTVLVTRIESQITKREQYLTDIISERYPTRQRMSIGSYQQNVSTSGYLGNGASDSNR